MRIGALRSSILSRSGAGGTAPDSQNIIPACFHVMVRFSWTFGIPMRSAERNRPARGTGGVSPAPVPPVPRR